MTPAQALFYLENAGGMGVPEIYRKMPWPLLVAPVQECAKSPNGYTDGTEQTPPSAGGKPPIREPVPFTGLVLRRGRRLSTPARLRAAFLYYLRRCGSVKEAAARAGIDRRTAQRQRDRHPAFDARWTNIVEGRRREVLDDVIMDADTEETRPIYYRGRQVGVAPKRDRALRLYLLKRHDAAAARSVPKTPHLSRQMHPANEAGLPSESRGLTPQECGNGIAP
jgi:hypothetical protein